MKTTDDQAWPKAEFGHEALEHTRRMVRDQAGAGRGRLTTATKWTAGTQTRTQARQFDVGTDEPLALGGADQALDPLELLMAALGSCLTIGWVKQAKLRGVSIRNLEVIVEATYDLRGYLGLDMDVRPGLEGLSYRVLVDCNADAKTLSAIQKDAERASPLFDNIFNGTPVQGMVTVSNY